MSKNKSDIVYDAIVRESKKTYNRSFSMKELAARKKAKDAAVAIAKALQTLHGVKNV